MSYFCADSAGYLGDVASIGGMRAFRAWALSCDSDRVRSFIQQGWTDDPVRLASELSLLSAVDTVDQTRQLLVKFARQAADVLIVTEDVSPDESADEDAVAKWDPDQPRVPAGQSDGGQWTGSGSGGGSFGAPVSDYANLPPDQRLRTIAVTNSVHRVANVMGYDASRIHVVYNAQPREFIVGEKTFREAGHFDPKTSEIQINAYNTDELTSEQVASHEISHAHWAIVKQQAEAEMPRAFDMMKDPNNPIFDRNGYPRPGTEVAFARAFPANDLLARHFWSSLTPLPPSGDGDLVGANDLDHHINAMVQDDGVSEYSRAYWDAYTAVPTHRSTAKLERAIDETLAETTRRQLFPRRQESGDRVPVDRWARFATDVRAFGRAYLARQRAERETGKRVRRSA